MKTGQPVSKLNSIYDTVGIMKTLIVQWSAFVTAAISC